MRPGPCELDEALHKRCKLGPRPDYEMLVVVVFNGSVPKLDIPSAPNKNLEVGGLGLNPERSTLLRFRLWCP